MTRNYSLFFINTTQPLNHLTTQLRFRESIPPRPLTNGDLFFKLYTMSIKMVCFIIRNPKISFILFGDLDEH